jgi:hypothetical protein
MGGVKKHIFNTSSRRFFLEEISEEITEYRIGCEVEKVFTSASND